MTQLNEVFETDAPVALITGSGAARVGRAIALRLADAGCRIALHANSSVEEAECVAEELAATTKQTPMVVSGDLSDAAVPDQIVNEVHGNFGRLDILINSAAIWHPTALEDVTAEEVKRYFDVNALGTFLCARAAGLLMVQQTSGGCIVNIGDWATVRPYLDHAAYFPSKGAVEVMSRSLAVELAHRNRRVRVNCVQPGPVLLGEGASEDYAAMMASSTLVGRVGTPQDVAHAVQFLCENDFVTGVCLPVDGGRAIFSPDGIQSGLNSG